MRQLSLLFVLTSMLIAQNTTLDLADDYTLNLYRTIVLRSDSLSGYLLNPHLSYDDLIGAEPNKLFDYLFLPHTTAFNHINVAAGYASESAAIYYGQLRSGAYFNNRITFHNEMVLDNRLAKSEDYIGKEWRGLTGYTKRGFFRFAGKHTRFLLGRDFVRFGLGKTGNLLFSTVSRPFDQIRILWLSGRFSMNAYLIQLENRAGQFRHLYLHRFTIAPIPNLILSFSEAALNASSSNSIELALFNPFLIYHAEQENGPNLDFNTMGTVELAWRPTHRVLLWSELLLDDFQVDKEQPGDLEPNEIGGLFGFEIADWFIDNSQAGLEFILLTNRTYKTQNAAEWWLHRNDPIGYELGSDLFRGFLWYQIWLNQFAWTEFSLDYLQQGEGELDQPWDEPWAAYTVEEGYDEPFPTGVIETSIIPGFKFNWISVPHFELAGQVGYRKIWNMDHQKGKDGSDWFFQITLQANLSWKLF